MYQTFLSVFLLPAIRGTGRVLLWDNHSTHFGDEVDELLRREGHVYVSRPPNSPDLSFIEPLVHITQQALKVSQTALLAASLLLAEPRLPLVRQWWQH